MIVFFRGVAQLVARLLWEQEAASSSLATPTMKKATIQRQKQRLYRGFLCHINARNMLERATEMQHIQKKPVLPLLCAGFGIHSNPEK